MFVCLFFIYTGTQPGIDDIVPFTQVSVTNNIIIHELSLQNGYEYYATIRGNPIISSSDSTNKIMLTLIQEQIYPLPSR